MESIAGYDNWKLASPEEYVDDDEIRKLEKTVAGCPFLHDKEFQRPYFQETTEGWFVTCDCGVNLGPKSDYKEAVQCWNTRISNFFPRTFREGARAYWPGA